MKIYKHESINGLKNSWERIYNSNPRLSVYQDYELMKIISKYSRYSPRRYNLKPIFYEVFDDSGNTILIAPFYIKKKSGETFVYLLGDFVAVSYLDMIYYPELETAEFECAMRMISEDLGHPEFIFNKINRRSKMNSMIREVFGNELSTNPKPCVEIKIPGNYEKYFEGLSSNKRNNIRKAHRRVENEGISMRLDVYENEPIDRNVLGRMMDVYNKRAGERIENPFVSGPLGIAKKKLNPLTVALGSLNFAFGTVLYFDGKVVAMCAGLKRSGRIETFYLAIDSDYKYFTPGGLMLTETIKFLCERGEVEVFDLTRGDEPYKFQYGGTATINDDFKFKLVNRG